MLPTAARKMMTVLFGLQYIFNPWSAINFDEDVQPDDEYFRS